MPIQVVGDAPGFTTEPASGINATLYRFELRGGALHRVTPSDVEPSPDRMRRLIDVLLNEDEIGRYLFGVRGFVVPRLNKGGAPGEQREFDVGTELLLAIGEALAVGPRLRHPPRLATLDGRRVE